MSTENWILVTGSTDGIGRQTALELARRGFGVILHGRSLARVQQVRAEITAEVPGARLEAAAADFSALREVRALAADILARFPGLNGLVNNAGLFTRERQLSADGFELQFAVNHLAPFLLTQLLLERLKANAPARIVTVSSTLHTGGQIEFDNLQGERKYSGSRAYRNTKLANLLFSMELAERLRGSGVTANALHPGAVDTKMLHTIYPELRGISPAEGAATSVYLASSPEVAGVSGQYFESCRPAPCSPLAQDAALRQQLWQVCADLASI